MPRPDTRPRPHAAYSAYRRFYCQPFVAVQQYRGATQDHNTVVDAAFPLAQTPPSLVKRCSGAKLQLMIASESGSDRVALTS